MTVRSKRLLFHLPLIGLLLIIGFTALVDAGVFKSFRNESTFGLMLLVWYPLGALLAITQITLWVGWVVRRAGKKPFPDRGKKKKRTIYIGVLIATVFFLCLLFFRLAQRWNFAW